MPILAFALVPNVSAQLLDPLQVSSSGVSCPADHPDANNFTCNSNDINLTLVQLSNLVSCTDGEIATATFDIDIEVNANERYNPIVWISQNSIDPRVTGSICFASSIPDGPITHIPELYDLDANDCADIDVPSNNFTLANLSLGSVDFLCEDTDNDGKAEIPIMVTWNNSAGAACSEGDYPINQTPAKCDAFTAETDIDVVAEPGVVLTKAGTLNDDDGTSGVSAGDSITYAFTVTNTGNVPLTNVTLSDPSISVSGGPIASLAAGASDTTTFTGTYIVQQSDIDLGFFPNTATVNTTQGVSDTASFNQPLAQSFGITLLKTGTLNDDDGTAGVSAGDTISYVFTVTNTGNTTQTNIVVTDADPDVTVTGGPLASLAPGASDNSTFTGSYVITQADIDSGSFSNIATVTSDQSTDDDDDTQELAQTPEITLDKTGTLNDDDGTPGVSAGDSITYVFTVSNTGNVTLTNITVTDPDATVLGGPLASLAPGASDNTTFTGSYVVTQADIDSGSFTNIATATSDQDSDQDDDTQPLAQNPDYTLVKTASPTTYSAAGQVISYTFEFTNSGNVTLYPEYTIDDDKATNESCPDQPASLAPGESVTCSATYNTTQADVDNGEVTNIASGTAQDPADQPVTSNPDTETVTAEQNPSLLLSKSGSPDTYTDVGDVITYSYQLTNNGNVTLYPTYTIADDKSTDEDCPAEPASLAPGESVTCSATYSITQADLDNGSVTNLATGTAQDPDDQTVTSGEDDYTVNALVEGSLGMVKSADPSTYVAVDDVISYEYELTNNYNVTIYAPYDVEDDKSDDESCPAEPASLAPGESVTCTASYTITQTDLDNGSVTNVATATATDSEGGTLTSLPDDQTVTARRIGELQLVKEANPPTYDTVGDVITYTYELTNNYNLTIYAPYGVEDDKSDDESCPAEPASLAPGESVTCMATYTITQDDLDDGFVTNIASGTASDGEGGTLTSNEDQETVTAQLTGSLVLDKTASPVTYTAAGDVISYSYLLTNGTNITLFEPYTIDDDKSTDEDCPTDPASLAPGESVTCTATYTITEGDLTAGLVTNVASGTARNKAGGIVPSNEDSATVNAVLINLAKSAAAPSYNAVSGQYTVVYTITASNSGTAGGTYDLTDTFSPATGITLVSATIAYGGGETQTGTPAGALPYSFSNGETVVTDEGLGAGATETWTITAIFTVDPTAVDESARDCVVGQEEAGTGFYNSVTGVDSESDTTDNDACTNLPDPEIDLVKTAGDAEYSGGVFTVIYTVTANNLGDGPGYYDLSDSILPGNGITVSLAQLTAYNAGTENSQTGTLAGSLPHTFTSPATLVTGEALAGGRNESWTIVVEFDVDFGQIDETFACSETGSTAGTAFYNEVRGSDTDPDLDNNDACTNPSGGDALFHVTKDFTDDNTAEVRVYLYCNNGLPVEQGFDISEFGTHRSVTFVMTKFAPGQMDCDVVEDPVPEGYSETYYAPQDVDGLAESISDDELGCHFENVYGGLFECHITNAPDPVDVVVDKVWELYGDPGNVFSEKNHITIWCDGEIPAGSEWGNSGIWYYEEFIYGNDTVSTEVIPNFPYSNCWATENVWDSYIEIDNECGNSFATANMQVSAGSGDSCTITNTVFFEGIPTLNQYGLIVLALLMLGVGAVGFRRFV